LADYRVRHVSALGPAMQIFGAGHLGHELAIKLPWSTAILQQKMLIQGMVS